MFDQLLARWGVREVVKQMTDIEDQEDGLTGVKFQSYYLEPRIKPSLSGLWIRYDAF
jgi:hypothetical protein